jgi:hypothetical protein
MESRCCRGTCTGLAPSSTSSACWPGACGSSLSATFCCTLVLLTDDLCGHAHLLHWNSKRHPKYAPWPTVKADAERTSVLLAYVMFSKAQIALLDSLRS